MAALARVLRRGNIWCLNAGENYKVKLATWWKFVEEIKSTNVTVSGARMVNGTKLPAGRTRSAATTRHVVVRADTSGKV